MIALPAGALVERIAWTLLHFLWQGVLIAKLFTATRALAGRSIGPRGRYGLACATLAAMTLAPFITFTVIGGGASAIPATSAAWSARSFAVAGTRLAGDSWVSIFPALSQQVFPWLVTAWLCGVLAFSIRLAGGWAVVARMRSPASARPAPAEWQDRLNELALRMRLSRPVRLLVSSLAQAPIAAGYLRPAILMPIGALTGLPIEQIEALLAHELAHILRHDYLVNLLQGAAEALLFYHPCVWWISNQIRAERELCCDDFAVRWSGDVLTYARALEAVESARPARLHAAMAAGGGSLADRIRRLLDPSHGAQAPSSRGAAAALSVLLLAGIWATAMDRNAPPLPAVHVQRSPDIVLPPPVPASRPVNTPPAARHRRSVTVDRETVSITAAEPPEEPLLAGAAENRIEPREMPREGIHDEPRYLYFGNSQNWLWASIEGEPVLHAIELRGVPERFASELRAQLRIHEGDIVSHAARERIGNMAREYSRRLEFSMVADTEGGAVLRIHPPGAAGEPLVSAEVEPERKKK